MTRNALNIILLGMCILTNFNTARAGSDLGSLLEDEIGSGEDIIDNTEAQEKIDELINITSEAKLHKILKSLAQKTDAQDFLDLVEELARRIQNHQEIENKIELSRTIWSLGRLLIYASQRSDINSEILKSTHIEGALHSMMTIFYEDMGAILKGQNTAANDANSQVEYKAGIFLKIQVAQSFSEIALVYPELMQDQRGRILRDLKEVRSIYRKNRGGNEEVISEVSNLLGSVEVLTLNDEAAITYYHDLMEKLAKKTGGLEAFRNVIYAIKTQFKAEDCLRTKVQGPTRTLIENFRFNENSQLKIYSSNERRNFDAPLNIPKEKQNETMDADSVKGGLVFMVTPLNNFEQRIPADTVKLIYTEIEYVHNFGRSFGRINQEIQLSLDDVMRGYEFRRLKLEKKARLNGLK